MRLRVGLAVRAVLAYLVVILAEPRLSWIVFAVPVFPSLDADREQIEPNALRLVNEARSHARMNGAPT